MKQLDEQLLLWADHYENSNFIVNDPIKVPHKYVDRKDIEISAFITSWVAWGNRKAIISKAIYIDRDIMNEKPLNYIMSKKWAEFAGDNGKIYRTFSYNDFSVICSRLYDVYISYDSMESCIIEKGKKYKDRGYLKALQSLFNDTKGVPSSNVSACKRLCLFLRWMVRNGPVDFGLWTIIKPENLIIPLDVHVHAQALRLGITERQRIDITTAIEITDYMCGVFPGDPCKGDFALFGYGIEKEKYSVPLSIGNYPKPNEANEIDKLQVLPKGQKPIKKTLIENVKIKARHRIKKMKESGEYYKPHKEGDYTDIPDSLKSLKVADIIEMELFFDNVVNEISKTWKSREEARENAIASGRRLQAHCIDKIHKKGFLIAGNFIITYASILDKVQQGLSSVERETITIIGNTAYSKTLKTLIDNEKKKDNSNR